MRKLALEDDILLKVEKPARYIGGEIGSVMKDPTRVRTRFAMCFPDVYEIGMSHLGIQILYAMLNSREDIWCERVYSPWTDLDAVMRERHIPLFALESQDPVRRFDFLGITIQYEMCYTNILQILDLSGIPLHAEERSWDDPIVIGGGPCTYNPEPLAPFFDLFYIGEGETQMLRLIDIYQECRAQGVSREEFLLRASSVPGLYVPSLYKTTYHEDGTIASFRPVVPGVPERVRKEIETDLDHTWYPEHPIVPFIKVTQDRVVLEIQRGCIRGCRFCQAGMIYRPVRERSLSFNEDMARQMLDSTGQEEISLSSLSSSDYSNLSPLLENLIEECDRRHVNISLPSLRIDSFSLDVMKRVQDVRKSSLTFAPEAGTQRMRDVINKGLTEEDILHGASEAFRGGWNRVKLYFMIGLPGETKEDVQGIAELSEKVCETYYDAVPRENRHGKIQLTASSSFFVPKPFTPFQWAKMLPEQEYLRRARFLKDTFRAQKCGRSMHYQYHEADVTVLEGVLARGDRRTAAVVESAYRKGCLFDSWSDCFDRERWQAAFEENGVNPEFYTLRDRSEDEIFPWDFIDIGVTRKFLRREWNRAMQGVVTPNCRQACSGCGAAVFGCGICRTHGEKGGQAG